MQIIVKAEHAQMRLDVFLKEHFLDLSRARLQKLVKEGQVRVNGERVIPHHFLREGDEVEATVEPSEELLVVPNPSVSFAVLHEESDFLIINKPAGLVVHQGEGHKTPDTLANGLLARYPEIGKVGDDPIRPGIMHRLDGDVSGVIVIARTQDMFDHLKKQFKTHTIEKEYRALVYGKVTPAHGVIDFAIARKGAKMVARPKRPPLNLPLPKGEKNWGKSAVTEYETIKAAGHQSNSTAYNTTLLKVIIHTGRTHQIRVHLFAIDHPIVGDQLYEYRPASNRTKNVESKRLMLHARRLAFKDLKGERREFIIEPPEEFVTRNG